jgi:hypothetical protein
MSLHPVRVKPRPQDKNSFAQNRQKKGRIIADPAFTCANLTRFARNIRPAD